MSMSLSSLQLDAFTAVAKAGSFSKAASALHLTQSALSQRILNLERELSTSLIVRDPAGQRLTAAGEELLRYCRAKDSLERELLGTLTQNKGLGGSLRVAAFSSVTRSVLLPIIGDFIKHHPSVRIELMNREIRDLLPLLASNEVDLIFTTILSHKQELISREAGVEQNVLVRPRAGKYRERVYLDHDLDDNTTSSFLALQGKSFAEIERSFLDEVYAIADGVAMGLGQAVLPKHLVRHDKRLKVVSGLKALRVPFYLQYYRQQFYTQLHEAFVEFSLAKISDYTG